MVSQTRTTSIEHLSSSLLSDVFAAPLTALCVNQSKKFFTDSNSFVFQNPKGSELVMNLSPAAGDSLPFDWLLARFAHLLFKSSEKYSSIQLKERALGDAELIGCELLVCSQDKESRELCKLNIAGDLDSILEKFSKSAAFDFHPLEKKLFVPLQAKIKFPVDLAAVEEGTRIEIAAPVIVLSAGGRNFSSELEIRNSNLLISIRED